MLQTCKTIVVCQHQFHDTLTLNIHSRQLQNSHENLVAISYQGYRHATVLICKKNPPGGE